MASGAAPSASSANTRSRLCIRLIVAVASQSRRHAPGRLSGWRSRVRAALTLTTNSKRLGWSWAGACGGAVVQEVGPVGRRTSAGRTADRRLTKRSFSRAPWARPHSLLGRRVVHVRFADHAVLVEEQHFDDTCARDALV